MAGFDLSWHDPEASFLEAVFARGDRKLAPLLEQAWRLGCRFDGWTEHFSFKLWQQAFTELNIDPESYAYRRFNYEDHLPWDHLQCGVSKETFIREHRQSLVGEFEAGSNQ
ncbi:MAG: B12-binding domain-containing radical SAM protein, partial [Dethiobacteria bacterium]|nr:B12-binding domain-containing radical SAM protein [Dethiobacteria bacterium]